MRRNTGLNMFEFTGAHVHIVGPHGCTSEHDIGLRKSFTAGAYAWQVPLGEQQLPKLLQLLLQKLLVWKFLHRFHLKQEQARIRPESDLCYCPRQTLEVLKDRGAHDNVSPAPFWHFMAWRGEGPLCAAEVKGGLCTGNETRSVRVESHEPNLASRKI